MPALIIIFLCFFSYAWAESSAPVPSPVEFENSVTLSFERITLAALTDMVYSDLLHESYLIHSEVLQRSEEITVRLRSTFQKQDLPRFMADLLRSYGIQIEHHGSYSYFRPVVPSDPVAPQLVTLFYQPRYRDSSYLLSLLNPVFQTSSQQRSQFSNKRQLEVKTDSVSDEGANKLIDKGADGLLFTGTQEELDKFLNLVAEVDVPAQQVLVQAYVYEVSNTENDSTALHLAFNLLKGQVGLVVGALRSAGQALTVKTDNLEAVFNVFNSDTRFKVLSSPSVLVRSGESARFTVGTETPILSGISYPTQGSAQPVQSVEYRASGIIFEVKPKIYRERIDLELFQQISDFVATTTGVSSSPTLIKRDLSSSFSLKSGQIIIIGGLLESKRNRDSTYLPFTDWEIGSEKSHAKREIILFLHCEKVEDERLDVTPIADGFIRDLKDFQIVF